MPACTQVGSPGVQAALSNCGIHRGGVESCFALDPDDMHPLAGQGWSAAAIAIEIESPRLQSVSYRLDGVPALRTRPAPGRSGRLDSPARALPIALRRHEPAYVDIIVPVYEDYAATKACLDCLENEGSRIAKHVTVIDDRTPNADLRALLEERAGRGLFTLMRNDENLGFAGSINLALERLQHGDVLLLNADALLPRGAVDRLAAAAYSDGDIGTVTPLSNNGEFTSFPKANVANVLSPRGDLVSRRRRAGGEWRRRRRSAERGWLLPLHYACVRRRRRQSFRSLFTRLLRGCRILSQGARKWIS